MEIKQLEYFVAIVEQGTISKAAEALYMAQPPLSRQLKNIEDEIGEVLFERSNKKNMTITPKGELFYNRAKEILFKLEDSIKEVRDLGEHVSGHLKLGVNTYCSIILGKAIKQIQDRYKHVTFDIVEASSQDLMSYVKDHHIDFAITIEAPRSFDLEMRFLGSSSCVLVTSTPYDFTNNQVTLKQIAELPLILLKPQDESGFFKDILTTFAQYHIEPNILCECQDASMLLHLVKLGVGVAILPLSMLEENDLLTYDIIDTPWSIRPMLIWRKKSYRSKMASYFLDILKYH